MRPERIFPPLTLALAMISPVAVFGQGASAPEPAATPAKPAAGKPANNENWNTLALDGSGLAPARFNAVLLGKIETAEFTRETIRMQWRTADPMEVYVILPKGVTKPKPVLYLYDYKSNADRFRDEGWCRRATQGGVAAVGFVGALSGDRQHLPRPMKQWFVSELQEALVTTTHDVQMVVNYLASRGDIDTTQVGMIAQGSGGAVAVLSASVDPRIVALDLMDPWGDWPDWLKESPQIPEEERAAYVTPEFLKKVAPFDPVNFLPKLKLKALRVQQILEDPTTPPAARDKIAAAVPKTDKQEDQLVRYKTRSDQYEVWRNEGLSGWMKTQLQPAPTGASSQAARLSVHSAGDAARSSM